MHRNFDAVEELFPLYPHSVTDATRRARRQSPREFVQLRVNRHNRPDIPKPLLEDAASNAGLSRRGGPTEATRHQRVYSDSSGYRLYTAVPIGLDQAEKLVKSFMDEVNTLMAELISREAEISEAASRRAHPSSSNSSEGPSGRPGGRSKSFVNRTGRAGIRR